MKLIKILLAIGFLFVSFAFAQKELPTIKPGKTYQQSGAKITSPNQIGWQIVKAESLETVFEKKNADAKYNAFVKTKTIAVYENVSDLFENLEKLKQAELDMPNRDSLHFNRTNFKETPCLQYDGIFNNNAPTMPTLKYFNFNGYLCRHPNDKSVVIQMEFSNYSNSRGFTEVEHKAVKDFFEKLQFSKIKSAMKLKKL